jgi:hypothetical protein
VVGEWFVLLEESPSTRMILSRFGFNRTSELVVTVVTDKMAEFLFRAGASCLCSYLAVSVFGKFDVQLMIDFHRDDQGYTVEPFNLATLLFGVFVIDLI